LRGSIQTLREPSMIGIRANLRLSPRRGRNSAHALGRPKLTLGLMRIIKIYGKLNIRPIPGKWSKQFPFSFFILFKFSADKPFH
jgi:hypothetical protein